MTNSGNSPHLPGRSSRLVPAIYLNVDVGISFSSSNRPRATSFHYTSRAMQERMYREQEEAYQRDHQLAIALSRQEYEHHCRTRDTQQERQRRMRVRPFEQHERGSSAPPTLRDVDNYSDTLVSPCSPQGSTSDYYSTLNVPTFPSAPTNTSLPYSPTRFRLSDGELPWSSPQWPTESESTSSSNLSPPSTYENLPCVSPSRTVIVRRASSSGQDAHARCNDNSQDSDRRRVAERTEDPQRVRELEQLHQAMMTVDSLHHNVWETSNWEDSVGELTRGPRSLGWAVRTNASTIGERSYTPPPPPPPPYVENQWEQRSRRM